MKFNHHLDIYEKPIDIISTKYKTAKEISEDCIYFLDTNVLLLPYTTGSKELNILENVYSNLVSSNKLYIPEQVLKEFAKNRPTKLCDMYKVISDYLSTLKIKDIPEYQLIYDTDEYKSALENQKLVKQSLNQYQNSVRELLSLVQNYNWDDPVSTLYRKIFKESSIISSSYDFDSLKKELENRHTFNLPPAFKDKGKDDAGIGDYIIWKSILDTGLKLQKNIIFVTGDEKADWFHQSNNARLYPRFELLYEFNQFTKGQHIAFISLSGLLEEYHINSDSIEVIRNVELIESARKRNEYKFKLRNNLFKRSNGRCEKCGKEITIANAVFEHITPISKGGEDTLDNTILICELCSVNKNSKFGHSFHGGSPCEMSGQECPACHVGIMDVDNIQEGVVCNKCGLFIPAG